MCSGGECKSTCDTSACQTCVNGVCQSSCANCQTCNNGVCSGGCDSNKCETCVGGKCKSTCNPNNCEQCVGGKCVSVCNGCQTCSAGTCSSKCSSSTCEVCEGTGAAARCVNQCVSSKSTPCPNGVACEPGSGGAIGDHCQGTWCAVSGSPGQYTECPTSGKCGDGSDCIQIPCGSQDCGFCNGSTGQCESWATLCIEGYQCVCDDKGHYPDPSCYREKINCPAGSVIPTNDLFICPKESADSPSYWCPGHDGVLKGGTCPDGSECLRCSDPKAGVFPANCCVCCPDSICGGL